MPFTIDVFKQQIEQLQDAGKNDRDLQIKLQSRIFEIANTLKDLEGSVVAMHRFGIVDQKRAEEAAFTRWLSANPDRQKKYAEVLPSLQKAYEELTRTAQRDLLVQQLAGLSDVFQILSLVNRVAAEKQKPQAERNSSLIMLAVRARGALPEIFADRNAAAESSLLAFLLRKAAELPAGQKLDSTEKRFGNLQGEARVRAEEAFARSLAESKNFATAESVNALFEKTPAQLKELSDSMIDFAGEVADLAAQVGTGQRAFNATVARWRPLLVQGMSEMRAGNAGAPRGQPAWGASPYPDANRTLRFTYGDVRGYVPHDAAIYQPFTNLSGVIEKDTGREPFDVPAKLKQLYRAHDFGPYATPDGQNVPVNFLSTTDIIGGNSGSPIMNGRGEQVGIIFDGNYEGLGNDFFYNDAKGRAISVDIRYVLFIADKFGGAGYILKELDIKNAPTALRRAA